ncbi:MAG: hypothetical protein V1863_05095 [Candidatus Omnitrophota bacterium]
MCKYFGLDNDLELVAVVTLGVSGQGSVKSSRKALKKLLIKKGSTT